MTTVADLPLGTRCLVDVVAMERDGPEAATCGCKEVTRILHWREMLRLLAEQPVIVASERETLLGCCKTLYVSGRDEVSVDGYTGVSWAKGFLVYRKYLLPLPEQRGETDREVGDDG